MAHRAISRMLVVLVLVAFATAALIAFDGSQASPQGLLNETGWDDVFAQEPLTTFGDLGFNEIE